MIHRKIELLAPAKNLLCGIEAINHGADAVYIGAPLFSARFSAGNSIEDIEQLVKYSHQYYAKVYVALNTILKEEELPVANKIIWQLYEAGIDALIIQDMAILEMDIPPIALHASTQMDNRMPDKVGFLENSGFSQVILARELSLSQIEGIAKQTNVSLEFFIHGALCVCYSGQCYLSHAFSGRSANRGECAQYCRLRYTLQDDLGKILVKDKHLLSLKDLNHSDNLEKLLDAGISSLKIEGRLKELSYVKNITAYYRKQLDKIFERRLEYQPSSSGNCSYTFTPCPEKSFNRGFTDYFLKGRKKEIPSLDTPKSTGEYIGKLKELTPKYLKIFTTFALNNGDGLCFFNKEGTLEGFRVNRVEKGKVFPAEMPDILIGTPLYRNYDNNFEKILSSQSAVRKISVIFSLKIEKENLVLQVVDSDGNQCEVTTFYKKELARTNQLEEIKSRLSKVGNTIFEVEKIHIEFQEDLFIPASLLAELRRKVLELLQTTREMSYFRKKTKTQNLKGKYIEDKLTYRGNVSNSKARQFYVNRGVLQIDDAFEINPLEHVPLMFSKYCLKYQLGYCPKMKENQLSGKNWYLSSNQVQLKLEFDCEKCEMKVYKNA